MKKYLIILCFSVFLVGCQKWEYQYFEDVQPVLLWAEDIESTGFRIYWTESKDPHFDHYDILMSESAGGFYITRCDDDDDIGCYYANTTDYGRLHTTKDRSETTGNLHSLDPETDYYLIVRVYSIFDTYADSNVLHVTTTAEE